MLVAVQILGTLSRAHPSPHPTITTLVETKDFQASLHLSKRYNAGKRYHV